MAKKKEELDEEMKNKTNTEEKSNETLLREAQLRIKELEDALAAAEEKEKENNDRLLRTLAEYDNFKKRTVREKEEIYAAAQGDVIRHLLPVFDNFERAQQFSTAEDYAKGVDMILESFSQTLEKMQIRAIAEVGSPFDPVFHEAVFREEKEGVEENTITEVLQKGYAIGDKVIRHAMVKVSG